MDIIVPTTLTSAMLVSSNIAENEYSEWATGGFDEIYSGLALRGISRSGSGKLWAYVYGGYVYYSDDDGVTWTNFDTTTKNWNCICCLNQDIYIGVNGGKIWVITNETGTLTELSSDSISGQWMCLGSDGTNVYGFNVNVGCYKRSSGAGAFSKINSIATSIRTFAYASSGICYLGTGGTEGIYASADGCVTYGSPVYAGAAILGLAVDSSGNVYATVSTSVLARLGGTGSFTDIGLTLPGWALGLCCDASNNIYASDYNLSKIYKCISTTSYSDGTIVQITTGTNLSDHKIYESLINLNIGNNPITDTTNWLLLRNTNRTKAFDGTIGAQSSKAAEVTWVLSPGAIDSVALMNISATSLRVAEADHSTDKVTNGTAWTGATGTTQPTGWDKIGTPSEFFINGDLALKITADVNGEGISQTIAVTSGTVMMLNGWYGNNTGDVAQYAVYDATHSADILAITDLPSLSVNTIYSTLNYVFTVPAGCTSITIKLLAKTSGDVVRFGAISLCDVVYDSGTVTIGAYTTEYTNLSLVQAADCLVRVSVYHATGNALVGEMVMGVKTNMGTTSKEISGGIKDYSTITEDTYGYQEITDRGIAKKLSCQVTLPITSFDAANSIVSYYHTTAVVWVASTTYNSTVIYGMYRDYKFQLGDKIATLFFDLQGLV